MSVVDCNLTFSKVRMIFEFLGEELDVWGFCEMELWRLMIVMSDDYGLFWQVKWRGLMEW